nr:hypothetical protein CFP56_32220 [Quercus suber]
MWTASQMRRKSSHALCKPARPRHDLSPGEQERHTCRRQMRDTGTRGNGGRGRTTGIVPRSAFGPSSYGI